MKKRMLIKLGGSALQDERTLRELAALVTEAQNEFEVVLVHGGGPAINAALTQRGIQWQFINGQRQTTPEMMSVIEDVLANQVNSLVVQTLQQAGIPAAGLSGAAGKTLFCTQANAELMQVGKIEKVQTDLIEKLLAQNLVPVIAPIGIGAAGEKYNINADWAAAQVAIAIKANTLLFLTDQNGILDADKNIISRITPGMIENLIADGTISGGMFTKVNTMLSALRAGVKNVVVTHAAAGGNFFSAHPLATHLENEAPLWN